MKPDDTPINDTPILSLEAQLEADDVAYVTVDVPEWQGAIRFGSLDAASIVEFAEANAAPGGTKLATLRLVVKSLVDAQGARLVLPNDVEAMTARYGRKNGRVMNRLIEAALTLNGVTLKEKAATKNGLSEAQSGASPSVLH